MTTSIEETKLMKPYRAISTDDHLMEAADGYTSRTAPDESASSRHQSY